MNREFWDYVERFKHAVNQQVKALGLNAEGLVVGYDGDDLVAHIKFEASRETFLSDAEIEQKSVDEAFTALMSGFEDPELSANQNTKLVERVEEMLDVDIEDFWD